MLHGHAWAIPLGRDQGEDTVRARKGISLNPLSLSDIIIFRSTAPVADTRHVPFYYRRVLDDRIMMGGRGEISEALARPIPEFHLASFRRLGQRAMFAWYRFRDR